MATGTICYFWVSDGMLKGDTLRIVMAHTGMNSKRVHYIARFLSRNKDVIQSPFSILNKREKCSMTHTLLWYVWQGVTSGFLSKREILEDVIEKILMSLEEDHR